MVAIFLFAKRVQQKRIDRSSKLLNREILYVYETKHALDYC